MLSAELARLRDAFDGWGRGSYPTTDTWHQFSADLHELTKKLALQEAGADLSIIEVLIQSKQPGSKIAFLPVERMRLRGGQGDPS